MRILKLILKWLGLLSIPVITFFLGLMFSFQVDTKRVASIAASGYLIGCVQAKTDIYGVTDGIIYNECDTKARAIFEHIMKMSAVKNLELGSSI
jgi:hypothetical protein